MEVESQGKEISAEELQLYDRQRFIGIEVQKRLLNAVVLLTPLNGVNTELAKNLILSGTNISIADSEPINQDDVDTNFMVAPADLGKNRGQVIGQKLREMNPMVKIEIFNTFDIDQFYGAYIQNNGSQYEFQQDFLTQFNIINSSTKYFAQMRKYEEICMKMNKPYYNLVCCGLYGFYYANLGSSFDFIKKKPAKTIVKDGKRILDDEWEEFEKVTVQGKQLNDTLDPTKNLKPIYKAIQMMAAAEQQNLSYDPFNPNQEVFNKIQGIQQSQFKVKPDQEQVLSNFIKFYGVEYCPVYSIIGSVASQEFIKVIGRDSEPGINWFIYDSQDGYGRIENIQGDRNYQKQDMPELRRKKETA